jgi:hypothetical protein
MEVGSFLCVKILQQSPPDFKGLEGLQIIAFNLITSILTFEEYLIQKKIDPRLFKEGEPERYEEFEQLFEQVHPNSFTIQKLNLINFIRRKYLLLNEPKVEAKTEIAVPALKGEETKEAPKPAVSRPAFKRKL